MRISQSPEKKKKLPFTRKFSKTPLQMSVEIGICNTGPLWLLLLGNI